MDEPPSERRKLKTRKKAAVRASITFTPDLYGALEEIAEEKKVSLAWVVRAAAREYVAGQSKRGNTISKI